MYKNLIAFFLSKEFSSFFVFHLLSWVLHLLLVSIASFFHFLLGHQLSIIEEWIYYHGWELLILSKGISTFVVSRFIFLNFESRNPLKSILTNNYKAPNRNTLVLVFFLLFMVMWLGAPKLQNEFYTQFGKLFLSYSGTFLFYFCDFLVIYTASLGAKKPSIASKYVYFWAPILSIGWSNITFLYAENISFLLLFNLFFCFLLGVVKKYSWSNVVMFLLLFACPVASFFGHDMIWGDSFSIVGFKRNVSNLDLIVLGSLGVLYLNRNRLSFLVRKES